MSGLLAACLVFTLLALLFLLRAVNSARRGRLLRAGGSTLSCVVSAAIASAAIVLALAYYGYDRLTAEQTISTIEFRRLAPDTYEARLIVPGARDRLFELRGDEWQIDARLINWKPPVTILGLDPIYRLERLSGRYSNIEREQHEKRTVHALLDDKPLDLWQLARRYPLFMPGVDAYYGTATYVPMSDGARYDIQLTRDALIARPVNDKARQALGQWKTAQSDAGPPAKHFVDYVQVPGAGWAAALYSGRKPLHMKTTAHTAI